MKKISLLALLLMFSISFAYDPVITKKVLGHEDLTAKEVVFLSGSPVVFEGTLTLGETNTTKTYEYSLTAEDGSTLTREVEFSIEKNEKSNSQIIETWTLDEFSESIEIGGTTYTLEDYEFSRSEVRDVKPVGDYYAGNINLSKTYDTESGKIKLNGTGTVVGYNTAWAKNETAKMSYTIQDMVNSWSGKYTTTVSDTDQRKIKYTENSPTEISFFGSFVMTENNISTLKYTSELPEIYNGKVLDYIEKDEDAYKYESFPIQSRLVEYNLSGIKGHWGEMDLRKAFALEFMDEWDATDTPDTAVTRGEFAKILALLLKIDIEEYADNEVIYKDVSVKNEYYKYIRALTEKGVIVGTGNSRFQPNAVISRAEAITMIINAIGFENRAPEAMPILKFNDADKIQPWAVKYIYIANKIGILNGNEMGQVMPDKKLTKAEIASICNRLITYLTEELSEEYIK